MIIALIGAWFVVLGAGLAIETYRTAVRIKRIGQ